MQLVVIFPFAFAVAHASVSVTRTINDGPHPSSMEIEVQLPSTNKKVRIPLTKTDAFENVPMTVTENGVSRTFSARQAHHADHAHYRDIESKSVISVRHENGKKRLSGHLMHEGTSYFVNPSGDSEHRVTRNIAKPELKFAQSLKRKKRQSNQAATEFEVELLVLCDHTVWKTFRAIYGTDEKAMTELHFYFTHILNGMDTVYRNIGNPSISVKCIGFKLAKTELDSKWMPPAGSNEASNSDKIIDYIASYIKYEHTAADHVMAFTRVDIHSGGDFAAIGLAVLSDACQEWRVSIIEDQGLHSWGTAAHELAHNLGAKHDNDDPQCKISSNYLMSPYAVLYDDSDIANSYRFSECTIKSIRKYLKTAKANCLRTRQSKSEASMTGASREGARLTLDQVCRLAFPATPGKFFLTEDFRKTPELICATISCTPMIGFLSRVTSSGLRAPVGSQCGNKQSCNWNGECVADEYAPKSDKDCFWGDSRVQKDYIKYRG